MLSYVACPAAPFFSTLSHKQHNIQVEKKLFNTRCALRFSLKLLSETFLILRRTQKKILPYMYIRLHWKYQLFLSDFNQTLITSKYFWNILKNQISWKSVHWEARFPWRWMDWQERHNKTESLSAILWTGLITNSGLGQCGQLWSPQPHSLPQDEKGNRF